MTRDEALSYLRDTLAAVKPPGPADSGEALAERHMSDDLGLDSLDLINLLFKVEAERGVKVPEPDIDEKNLYIVGNLADYLITHSQAA